MRTLTIAILAIGLAACRGEKTPRDFQNNPPAQTHPVTSSSDTPAAHGMPGSTPEPSKGAEGKTNRQPVNPAAGTTTMKDQAPTQTTQTTQTTSTQMTGTHLTPPP